MHSGFFHDLFGLRTQLLVRYVAGWAGHICLAQSRVRFHLPILIEGDIAPTSNQPSEVCSASRPENGLEGRGAAYPQLQRGLRHFRLVPRLNVYQSSSGYVEGYSL